jgi:hypothetical protein
MMDKTIALEQSGERRQHGHSSRTLALVMRHEWRLLGRDRTLWIVVALLAAMMAYGCWNGAAWIGFQQRTIAGALDEERERLGSMQRERDKRLTPLAANYEAQLQRQNDLAARLRFLSPALVMQSALNDLAGSSFDRYARFVAQVHTFHRQWQEFFLPKLFKRVRLSAGDYNLFPKFEYEEEAAVPVYRRVSLGLAGLLVSALAPAFAALRLLRRYPVVL